jgi:hypothetical protein
MASALALPPSSFVVASTMSSFFLLSLLCEERGLGGRGGRKGRGQGA